jgi:hypothetical protein
LQSIIESATFEPHPVSGEIEITDDIPVRYKRLDEETLQSQLPLSEYNLTVHYLWCSADQDGGGPGWRVAELLPRDGSYLEDTTWSASIGEANECREERLVEEALRGAEEHSNATSRNCREDEDDDEGEDGDDEDNDDDDYWAQYDNTPGRTPATKQSPAPHPFQYDMLSQKPGISDVSYFARYAEVQPALDSDDPPMGRTDIGESLVNCNAVAGSQLQNIHVGQQSMDVHPDPNGQFETGTSPENSTVLLSHPRPSSASSVGSVAVSKLEQTAENQSASELGVKLHIASNIKSLFRLAKSTGLSRREFESIVRRELELLNLIEDDD